MASVGKIKFSNILPVRLLPPSGINFHSTYPQVWLFFSDKKSACWHWPIWWSIVAASLALCCYSLVIRGSWDCHAAFHSESNQPQIATNLPKNTEQTDPKRCDHLSKHLPSRNDESRILPSISFCASMQTEVSLVNLGLTSFNNVLIRSLLKLLVIHLTRWKLSHNFHLLLKKKNKKRVKGKRKPTLKLADIIICPVWLHCLWLLRDCVEPLSSFCNVSHVSICLVFPSSLMARDEQLNLIAHLYSQGVPCCWLP